MMKNLTKKITDKIDLENFELSESYFYNGLPLCVIDSIYSIGVRYESVKNVISRFCEYEKITKYRKHKDALPEREEQYTVSAFLEKFENIDSYKLAAQVFENKQRTSPRSGILKSEAIVEFLKILRDHDIDTFQDLAKIDEQVERKIKGIKGQNSGISLQYFYMLSGSNDLIKPDRMIIRFLEDNLNRKITIEEALEIIARICEILESDFSIKITPRELDNAIWNYQRNMNR